MKIFAPCLILVSLMCCSLLALGDSFYQCPDDWEEHIVEEQCELDPCELDPCSDDVRTFAYYVGLSAGPMWHREHFFTKDGLTDSRNYHVGYTLNGSLGAKYLKYCMRAELEVMYRKNCLNCFNVPPVINNADGSGKTEDTALMLNIFKDFPVNEEFEIYLGVGAGIAFHKLNVTRADTVPLNLPASSNVFAWNVLAGGAINLYPCLTLTAGYRWFATEKVENKTGTKTDNLPMSHALDMGVRINF